MGSRKPPVLAPGRTEVALQVDIEFGSDFFVAVARDMVMLV